MILIARSSCAVPSAIFDSRAAVMLGFSARISRAVARVSRRKNRGIQRRPGIKGDLILDRDGKQRAKDDVCGGVAGFRLNIPRGAIGELGHARASRRASRLDRRKGIAQPPARKGRVDDASLLIPQIAIGQKHQLAQQGAQSCTYAI